MTEQEALQQILDLPEVVLGHLMDLWGELNRVGGIFPYDMTQANIDNQFIGWLYNEIHDAEIPEDRKPHIQRIRQSIAWHLGPI